MLVFEVTILIMAHEIWICANSWLSRATESKSARAEKAQYNGSKAKYR